MTETSHPVHDNQAEQRYEAQTPSGLARLTYRRRDGQIDLLHTEVPPEAQGEGFAAALADFALRDAQRAGVRVVPSCRYVAEYIEKHPEYRALVADA